jgi:nucleoid-associated protein YgaU
MGKDFRIGLIVGLVLALGVLLWVATRPSLTPQVQKRPLSELAQTDAGNPLLAEKTDPPAGSGRAAPADRSTTPGNAQRLPWPPQGQTPDPTSTTGLQQYGAMPAQTEPFPSSPAGANPTGLPDLTIYEKTEKIKTTRFHIVQRGETLAGIARRYYGAPDQWPRILAANEKVIKDPNKLTPGTKLIIPDADSGPAAPPKTGSE